MWSETLIHRINDASRKIQSWKRKKNVIVKVLLQQTCYEQNDDYNDNNNIMTLKLSQFKQNDHYIIIAMSSQFHYYHTPRFIHNHYTGHNSNIPFL